MEDRDRVTYRLVELDESPARLQFADGSDSLRPERGPVLLASDGACDRGKLRRGRFILVVLCAGLLLVGALVIGGTFSEEESGPQPDPNVKIGSLTGAGADLDKIAEEAQVSFSINAEPEFETGSAPGNVTIENLEINNNRFTVTINLSEDGREVYRSGYLDPGQYIDYAPLEVVLPPGDYPAVATLETYRLSDGTPIGRVGAELLLHVKG